MEWLNYHHLLYFWTVVRTGGIVPAARELRLAPSTVSVQVRRLEESLSEKLFRRSGRRLVLTEMGRLVHGYAEEIFSMGRELTEAVRGRPTGRPMRLVVGVADVVEKLVAQRLVEPALRLPEPVRVVCREASPAQLLGALARHEVDMLITDAPVGPEVEFRAYSHLLGESGVSFVATPPLAAACRRGFPASLDGRPMLMPTGNMAIRRSLDQWLEERQIRPRVVGEFEDGALLREFGTAGHGVFVAPTMVEEALLRAHRLRTVGRTEAVRARVYAISPERRIKHPAVAAICQAERLGAAPPPPPGRPARAAG
jgi:LysR family transcriptional regulator, transcriptional activator of nhaA